MTAEIAVANKLGVAIAADSAVTVEQLHKGKLVSKVYNSANKIFTLSKWHPVGAMIYNAATLGGTPWEIIIKEYRHQLGRESFSSLLEYKDDFFSKVENTPHLFPKESVDEIVMFNNYRCVDALAKKSANAGDFRSNIDQKISKLEAVDFVDGFDNTTESSITRSYKDETDRALSFIGKAALLRGNRRRIDRFIQLSFSRRERLLGYSGLVFCGFGRNEVFPRLIEYICDIVVCGKVRAWPKADMSVGKSKGSFVIPFADTSIIRTIIDGINPGFRQKQYEQALRVIMTLPKEILSQVTQLSQAEKDAYELAARKSCVDSFVDFAKSMDQFRLEEYVSPIEQTIGLLPLSDLAAVAETFLNASHVHKRVTPNLESVGGPVDVAVISKGDGFVWIKRKHYFDLKLNPSYTTKYLDSESE